MVKELSEGVVKELKRKRLFLFDMDGTIYIGDKLLPGILPLLRYIRQADGQVAFLTNNSSRSAKGYQEKLLGLGIEVSVDDILTSSQATGLYLQETHTEGKIYVLGTQALYDTLQQDFHLPVTKELVPDISCLVLGYDTELTYGKMEDACKLLKDVNLHYIATNPDLVCPVSFGYVPDCGSLAQSLYHASGRMPKMIGKPEATMALLAMDKYGYRKEETIMIGDRIYTDIACGIAAGICSLLVLSGESTMKTVAESKIKPDLILPDLQALALLLTDF